MDRFQKFLEIIFKLFPIVYLLGFCVIGGYLSNYSYSEYNILNLNFLKAGLLISSYFLFITFIGYNYIAFRQRGDSRVRALIECLFAIEAATGFLVVTTINPLFSKQIHVKALWMPIAYIFIIYLVCATLLRYYSLALFFKHIEKLNNILLFIVATYILIFLYITPVLVYYLLLILSTFLLSLGYLHIYKLIENKQIDYISIIIGIVITFTICASFGRLIYSSIPSAYGGGSPYKIKVDTSTQNNLYLKSDTLILLYENDTKYLIETTDSNIYAFDKDLIKSFRILKSE